MFDTHEEASMRIDKSIITGPTGPIYVYQAQSKNEFLYGEFKKKGGLENDKQIGDIRLPEFSVKPFRLGYVNRGGQSYYLQRMPVRKYKQGLNLVSLHVGIHQRGPAMYDKGDLIYDGNGFFRMYHDNYPSLEACLNGVNEMGMQSAAFSKEWAVGKDKGGETRLFYKTKLAGFFDEHGNVQLDDRRAYLAEALREVLV
jgi:hypothetical protein